MYKQRIEEGGAKEDLWLWKWKLAECFSNLEDWPLALYWYLEAFEVDPTRIESLRDIARHYRIKGKNELAYLFAKHGALTVSSSEKSKYELDFELSISSYYTRFKKEGFIAANALILDKEVPWHFKEQTYRNILFYVDPLPGARFVPITLETPLIREDDSEHYHPMNPSILKLEDGYLMICRTVNYNQMGAKTYTTIDPKGVYRTRNFLLRYDRQFLLLSQKEIVEDLPRERTRCVNVEGQEDCRIFSHQNELWYSCTTTDTNPHNLQISLCKLESEPRGDKIYVEKLIPLQGPDPHRCEKNWLPLSQEGTIQMVYSCGPLVIYEPNLETGLCTTKVCNESKWDFCHFRGSAAPIAFDEGYLMLIHEPVYFPDHHRCYLHRFVYLDREFVIRKLSKPFVFSHLGIEFCLGMVLDHTETQLILPIGLEDHEAQLCFVNVEIIRNLLEPLSLQSF